MTVASGKTLGYGKIHDVLLYISAKRPPNDADWAEYVAFFRKAEQPNFRGIVVERGSGPNAAQRKQITDIMSTVTSKVAVMSASPVARGVMTAMSWFSKGFQAFSPDEMDRALEYLGVPSLMATQVKQLVQKIQQELDY